MIEELADEGRVEVFDHQVARGLAESAHREVQQKPEAVAVSGNGMRAGPTLSEQAVGEERLQEGREGGGDHDCTSSYLSTRRSVASWSSSGTASMYQ